MGSKVSCTAANKEDKADAKAEKKKNAPVDKNATVETTGEAKAVGTVEITREEGSEQKTEEGAPKENGLQSQEEEEAVEEAMVAITLSKTEAAPSGEVSLPAEESAVQQPDGSVQVDTVQTVTVDSIQTPITQYIDEASTAETTSKEETGAAKTVETYDLPEDKGKEKENFLLQFRENHKIHAVDFMRIWRHYDKDGSGYLEKTELTNFLTDLMKQKDEETDKKTVSEYEKIMMSCFDYNKDGKLELSELAQLLPVEHNFLDQFPGRKHCTREDFNTVFDHYDKDKSGFMGQTELLALMNDLFQIEGPRNMPVKDIEEYAKTIMAIYDTGKDGRLTKEELGLVLSK